MPDSLGYSATSASTLADQRAFITWPHRGPPLRRHAILERPRDRRGVRPQLSRNLLDRPTLLAQVIYSRESPGSL